ncbi:MAG: hypothetical protein ACI4WH_07645 [Oscillospiraceae bacterium]
MKECFICKDYPNKEDCPHSWSCDKCYNSCDYCNHYEILDYQAEEVENIFGEYEEKFIPVEYCNYHHDFIENLER